MTISALIFDFDGTILDTETPEFESWSEVFTAHGTTLSLDWWSGCIGTAGLAFDPYAHLERSIGRTVDREAIRAGRRPRHLALIECQQPRPGVLQWITAARAAGLSLGVASTSSRDWVHDHLDRLALRTSFSHTACGDEVDRVKPAPDLYQLALQRLQKGPDQAIAIEDSPNGIAAAKAAGLFCIAVPNPLTEPLDLSAADLRLTSLAELPLAEVLRSIG
ncbi:HAD family hydrolase [Vineibacter terrae]|uniref:HAD family hydrolase n=1 Tax=Vineibacter terrae TaxID=2586908 RepID=UPI002E30F1B0|nr:HAD family hydrolase [Vineibacter terrae]HEX2890261.1 HAD family hydrolase [Vineibacter terrae]